MDESEYYASEITDAELDALADAGEFFLNEEASADEKEYADEALDELRRKMGLGPSATANYSVPTFGASLEIGKRWDFGHVFLESQGQFEGAWAGGAD